ncbi:hypothetical protein EC44_23650 [Salmonella enterica subsp. enterica serovar Anatum]|nr:hypothetical protein [Salmonella enterica subsp. enterica serovar Anatum]EEJ0107865.1 hypothetical protein [Salmonella enterica subsp. enterica]
MNSDPKTAAQRQREYANRQKQMGRRQRSFWLTDEEHQALSKRLKKIRAARNGGDDPGRA